MYDFDLLTRDPVSHLAILCEPYLSYILEGKKTIESRFTQNKCLPWGRVVSGDMIWLKLSGGDVLGTAMVDHVKYYTLNRDIYEQIIAKYHASLCITDEFYELKRKSKYATLIWLKDVHKLIQPLKFKQKGQMAWITPFTFPKEATLS